MNGNQNILDAVYRVILDRKANPSDASYTASLMRKGTDKILKKLGEEATEVVIAGKGASARRSSMRWPTCSTMPWCCWGTRISRLKRSTRNCAAASAHRA